MNNKLIRSALAIVAMMYGTVVLAQTTTTTAPYPFVATGDTVVMKDQVVTSAAGDGDPNTAGDDMENGDVLALRLPTGVNFSGVPTATATGATLSLQASNGDPVLSGDVTLSDEDGDGKMDRAEVKIATSSTAGDTITWKGSITYSGTSKTGNLLAGNQMLDVSLTPDAFTMVDADNVLATKVAVGTTGALARMSTKVIAKNEGTLTAPGTALLTGSEYLVTVPKGAGALGVLDTVSIAIGNAQAFGPGSAASITAITDGAPALAIFAKNGTTPGGPALGDTSFILDVPTSAAGTTRENQYILSLSYALTTKTTAGDVTLSASGDAGVSGSTAAYAVSDPGSTAKLVGTTLDPAVITELVRGAAASQLINENVLVATNALSIKEIFMDDLLDTETITLTAPLGTLFDNTATVAVTGAGTSAAAFGTPSVLMATGTSTIVVTLAGMNNAAVETMLVTGIKLFATSIATGNIAIAVGTAETDSVNAPAVNVDAATSIEAGVALIVDFGTSLNKVGPGTTGNSALTAVFETTYGAVTTGASTNPFVSVTPQEGVTITGVSALNYTGSGLTFGTAVAATPADGSWVLPVTAESNTVTKLSLVSPFPNMYITVTYTVKTTVEVGTTITMTFAGDAGISGAVAVGSVETSTIASVAKGNAIPDHDASATTRKLAKLSIVENFSGAIDATNTGEFRLFAPAGISFDSDLAKQNLLATGTTVLSVTSTWNTNDTLTIVAAPIDDTSSIGTMTVTPWGFISDTAPLGLNEFTIADGNSLVSPLNEPAGVTGEAVALVYVGLLPPLDAGDNAEVVAGFSASQSVADGLAPYTVESSDEDTVTASVDGTTLTIVGVVAGSATVTVTDDLGATDNVVVDVASATPPEEKETSASDGSTTTAVVSGGVSTDGGATYSEAASVGDAIDITMTVEVEAGHDGELGNFVAVIEFAGSFFAIESDGTVTLYTTGALPMWNEESAALASSTTLDITAALGGAIPLTADLIGTINTYAGYMVDGDDTIYFNNEAVAVTVTAL